MIAIKAQKEDKGLALSIKMEGPGEEIVEEAVRIMQQIPKQLRDANQALYFHFLAKMVESGDFGVAPRPDDEEDEEENEDV